MDNSEPPGFILLPAPWILAVLLCLSVSENAQGQDVTLRPGVKAGATMMTHAGADAPSYLGYLKGVAGGGFVQIRFGGPLSLQAELSYVQKGARGTKNGVTLTRLLHYIELPVVATYRLPAGGSITPTLSAGTVVSFNQGAKATVRSSTDSQTRNPGNVRTTMVGLTLGVGPVLPISRRILTMDVRYEFGLNSIEEFSGDVVRTQGVILTMGIAF